MEKVERTETETRSQREAAITTQKEKLLLLFYLLKKLKISFKTSMFLALVKVPATKKHFDKWAFIFRSKKKLPFGLEELATICDMAKDQLEGLIIMEAKEVLFDIEGKKEKCFAVTLEVDLSKVKGADSFQQGIMKGLKR